MRDFNDLFEKIKDILSNETEGKIKDFHVAEELSLTPNNLYNRRNRNSLPFEEILDFCKRREINPLEMFYVKDEK